MDAFSKAWHKIQVSPKSAESDLRAFATKYPDFADLAVYGQAKALQATNPARSYHLYDSLSELVGDPLAILSREAHAELRFLGGGNPDPSEIEALRAVLGKELRSSMRLRLERRLLADLAEARQWTGYDSLFRIRLTESVSLREIREGVAKLAFDTLVTHGDGFRFLLAKALFSVDRSDTALELLDSLAARRNLTSPEWILKGRIFLDLGKVAQAMGAFRKAAEDPREEQAFLWIAKGLERVGRTEDAQEAQGEFARRWPKSAKAQEILWARGMDAERLGNCSEATSWYGRVKDGGGRRAEWARFRDGYCWFRIGDFAKAEKLLAKERLRATGTYRNSVWYFDALALQALGKDSMARAEFAELAKTAPWSFHGHLARRKLGIDSVFADSLKRVSDTGALVWPGEQPVALQRTDSVAFLRFLCGQEIEEDWLTKELSKALDQAVGSSGARELALVLWMKSLGMERDATPRARKLLGRLSMDEISRLSKPVMRLFYPMPYLAETKPMLARDTVLNASFVHAVMRQESGYDRFAKSGAGAIGLLQLMPPTARAMAKKAGMKGYSVEQLTDPGVNLRLGITYLRDLARVWKGQLPLVLANYNAGPGATMRWMDGFLKLPIEQATEEITYWETRDYVKKCMANYWTYQLLYPESR